MSTVRNIDLDASEVEFDDGEEVCGDQNCERDRDSFAIIRFYLHCIQIDGSQLRHLWQK